MIGRKNRFHGYNSLNYVYRHGQTARGQLLSLKYAENPKRKEYRVAVVVSKKVSKSAVVRNRIRRRVYEAIRQHDCGIVKPYDLVFTVFHQQVATMPIAELQQIISDQLSPVKDAGRAIIGKKEN
jgi:ribonuclease P protein component